MPHPDTPWQVFLVALEQIPRERARRLLDAMLASRSAQFDGKDFMAQFETVKRQAYPDQPNAAVFALRQSVEESHG